MTKTIKHSVGKVLKVSMAISATMLILLSSTVFATQGTPESESVIYKIAGMRELRIHLHYPPGWKATDNRGAIIFFFGGGWNSGSVGQFLVQAEYLASRGLVAARADYRVRSRDGVTPDKCVEDARSAVRWMRQNSRRLGINPDRLIASGGSAGGHLAGCTMIRESVDADGDDLSVSTVPQAMVLFNPVLNLEHEQMIKRLNGDKQLARKISPTLHLDKNAPPALILFGTEDRLKVHGDEYWEKAEALDVRAEKYIAQGQGHGFFNRSPWKERTLVAADKFLTSLGFLKGEPTVKVPPTAKKASGQQGRDASNRRNIVARLRAMDKDEDGKISRDEAQGQLKRNFDRADSNSDGFIDRKELNQVATRLQRGRADSARAKAHPDVSKWQDLFAPDLSDAVFPEGIWVSENGILTASEDQAIWTTRDYDNFVLDLEFKTASGTNSGVVVYCSDMEDWIPNSVEIQIADDYAEKWAKAPETWHCGAIFGHLAPSKTMVKKPGNWNRFTIRCVDQQINVALNGGRAVSMDMSLWTSAKTNPDGSEIPSWLSKPVSELPTKGRIGLQGKHAGAPIWFRNIKIKEI
ncbi:MAG: family 16 glycoside hydrolase [Planctomycetota bacterium]|jgi:acetyl esterase/lipase